MSLMHQVEDPSNPLQFSKHQHACWTWIVPVNLQTPRKFLFCCSHLWKAYHVLLEQVCFILTKLCIIFSEQMTNRHCTCFKFLGNRLLVQEMVSGRLKLIANFCKQRLMASSGDWLEDISSFLSHDTFFVLSILWLQISWLYVFKNKV